MGDRRIPRTIYLAALLLVLSAVGTVAAEVPWCTVPGTSVPGAKLAAMARRLEPQLANPPTAVAHVHTEHTLPHQGLHDSSVAAERGLPLMRDAALVWRANADPASLGFATAQLNAWMQRYQPNFNPIDETHFDALAETYAIVAPTLPAESRDAAAALLRRWAGGYLMRMEAHEHKLSETWVNNFQSQRIKLATMFATALRDRALFDRAAVLFRAQLDNNLRADGSVLDFELRDALHYVVGDLEPLLRAALAARSWGEDWYHLRGRPGASLADAAGWLAPYARGDIQHEEFVHSRVAFDAERARAGIKGYAGPFERRDAAPVFWLAAQFDPDYRGLARALGGEPPPLALCGQ